MDLELLNTILARHGEPPFRARQVWSWTARGAESYEQMTDLPAPLRRTLARELPFSSLRLSEQSQARDGTLKALFQTADGRPLESVLMRYRDGRRSACLSSQSGCALSCSFCATGAMSFARNLTSSEILEQALHFRRAGHAPTHCVFMGMGEPMLNLDAVLEACARLPEIGVGHRRTTISTVGWVPGIERLASQPLPLRLAISVHAAEESLRAELMPVSERYPLREVLAAARDFYARRRRRVFIEYVMLAGVNDRYEQALALARALAEGSVAGSSMFKVNLIPYNPTAVAGARPFRPSTRASIAAFADALRSRGIAATVRLTRGRDIDAACGQLAARPSAAGAGASLARA